MTISLEELVKHQVPLDKFSYHWRFDNKSYDLLPEVHLSQLQPLSTLAAQFVWNYISAVDLHANDPFKQGFFITVEHIERTTTNELEVKKWLYQCGLPFQHKVLVSWTPTEAMLVPWKLLVKYYYAFAYSGSDDVTVIDPSLNWALLFHHENRIYFGTNERYIPIIHMKAERSDS